MGSTKRILLVTASCLVVAAFATGLSGGAVFAQAPAAQAADEPLSKTCRVTRGREVEIQRIEPFKVFDNLYHVGPCYVSVWLLTTPEGHILFDSAQEPFVDDVIANIQKVGVNLRDIKYILINHGHLDHAGGAARLQEVTGARVAAVAGDWPMIEALEGRTGSRDPRPNRMPKRDIVVNEGDKLDLGDQHLTLHTSPGHTPGVMFVEGILLKDGPNTYKGIWGGGGLGAPGLAGAEQGVINARRVSAVEGVQVYLQTHSWQEPNGYPGGGIHERALLLKTRQAGDPHPFVDPDTWNERVRRLVENAERVLAEERAKAAAGAPR